MSITIQDIHQTIDDLEYNGCQLTEIEAFLINTDDLQKLHKWAHNQGINPIDDQGKMIICGVKIVDSRYVERGSIFKIFKNKQPFMHPPGISGVVPIPHFSDIDGDFYPTVPESGTMVFRCKQKGYDISTMDKLPEHLQPSTDIDEQKKLIELTTHGFKQKEKKKHSQTRKIELGE